MAIGQATTVVKVIGAGLASLQCIPYFTEELLNAGIPMLRPRAMDHDPQTIAPFLAEVNAPKFRDLLVKQGYLLHPPIPDIANFRADDWVQNIGGNLTVLEGLKQRNPVLYDAEKLASVGQRAFFDCPAALAEWVELNAGLIWQEMNDEWQRFRQENPSNQRLVVLIPYCPEGPTSGTIGIHLGSKLVERVQRATVAGDLGALTVKIYGIELCPPMNYDEIRNDETARRNAFRGIVARKELLGGNINPRPFDACFVVDAVRDAVRLPVSPDVLLAELDKSAAKVGVAVVKAALGGDVGEHDTVLGHTWRWEVIPLEIHTEPSEIKVLPYLTDFSTAAPDSREALANYRRAAFKLKADQEGNDEINAALQACNITPLMVNRVTSAGEEWRQRLVTNERTLKNRDSWLRRLTFMRPSVGEVRDTGMLLQTSAEECQAAVDGLYEHMGPPEVAWKPVILGYNIELSRREIELFVKEPTPLASLMTAFQIGNLRDAITESMTGYLQRFTWNETDGRRVQNGSFARIIVSFMGHPENRRFLPSIMALAQHTRGNQESNVAMLNANQALLSGMSVIDFHLGPDIFLFAADATLEDVASYRDLVQVEHDVLRDPETWLNNVKYYAVEVPQELVKIHAEK